MQNEKMVNGEISLMHRFIAFFLVCVILFTTMPYKKAGAEGLDLNGVGIYNNVYTAQTGITSGFQIELYKLVTVPDPPQEGVEPTYSYQKVALTGEYQFSDSEDSIVYLNDGVLYLQQGRTVKFFENNTSSPFKNFLISNRIARIVIKPILEDNVGEEGNVTHVKVLEEYDKGEASGAANSGSFSEIDNTNFPTGDPAKDDSTLSTSKVYKLQYQTSGSTVTINNESFTLKEFRLTPMVDVNMSVLWRDTNSGRPAKEDINFNLSRGVEGEGGSIQYSPYPAEDSGITLRREIIEQDSNNVIYSYSVPERSSDNKEYIYIGEEVLPDPTGSISNYSITADESKTHFTNYSLKDFTCKINWLDSAHSSEITKNIDFDFINTFFELKDETDPNNITNIPLTYTQAELDAINDADKKAYIQNVYEQVTDPDTGAVTSYRLPFEYSSVEDPVTYEQYYQLKFKNLFEITEDGMAKVYSVKQKANEPIPVSQVTDPQTPGYTPGNDSYVVTGVNSGVRSNIVDRAYQDGELHFLLTGTTTFEGPLAWADIDNQTNRENAVTNGTAGDFLLYRYVNDPNDPTSKSRVAQVGTWTIKDVEYEENGVTKHKYVYADSSDKPIDIAKYDNSGKEYVYFAKERLSLSGYSIEYFYDSGGLLYPFAQGDNGTYYGTAVFPNGATVKNSLTGSIAYGVDAKWIAAELQGGTAEIQYQLQRFNASTGEWENIDPEHHTADPSTGTPAFTEGQLTIDGFSAEMMEKNGVFYPVNQYDETGHAYQYRVVQTDISRTDNNKTETYTTDIEMAFDSTGSVKMDGQPTDTRRPVKLIGSKNDEVDYVRITIGSHDFEVRVFWNNTTGSFDYEYKLVGEVKIIMNKDWDSVPRDQLLAAYNANVTLQLLKYNYTSGRYVTYNPGIDLQYTDGSEDSSGNLLIKTAQNSNGQFIVSRNTFVDGYDFQKKYAVNILNLPRYDDEGHLNRFSLTEVTTDVPGSPIYSSYFLPDGTQLFTAKNIFGDGGERIDFHKVWMDDGEEEYKSEVGVDISARAMPLPIKSSSLDRIPNIESLTDDEISDIVNGGEESSESWIYYNSPYVWGTTSTFKDTDSSLGYRYKQGDTFPNTYKGIDKCDLKLVTSNGQTSPLSFKVQRKLASAPDTAFADVTDITVPAQRFYDDIKTYSGTSLTVPAADTINGKFSLVIKNLPKYYTQDYYTTETVNEAQTEVKHQGKYVYTYSIVESNYTGATLTLKSGTQTSYIVKANSTGGTGDFNFKIQRIANVPTLDENYHLQTDGNGNTITHQVTDNVSCTAETYVEDKSYAPVNGKYTITDGSINGRYYLRLSDLPQKDGTGNGYEYRLVNASDNNTVIGILSQLPYEYQNLDNLSGPLQASEYHGLTAGQISEINDALNYKNGNGEKMMLTSTAKMTEESIWMDRVEVRIGYTYNNNWNLKDFQERLKTGLESAHTFTFRNDNIVEQATNNWLTMLPAQYESSSAGNHVQSNKSNVVDLQNAKYRTHDNSNPLEFEWFAGVYKAVYDKNNDTTGDYDRYYAVQEKPTISNTSLGDRLSDVTFTNTRIGIVNYHINLDWKVGSRLDEMREITVKIMADYGDGHPQAVMIPVEGQSAHYTDQINITLQSGVNDYYITNLPKYTNTGKIIKYSIEEVKINGTQIVNSKCTLDYDEIYAEIEEKPYQVNQKSNSDDLIPVVITNTFKGTTDFTVNKIWKDNTNKEYTRSDLYINLYRYSTDPAKANDLDESIFLDHKWQKKTDDYENFWSFNFDGLDKYDDKGYRYEYYVRENTDTLKTNDYATYYENAHHMTAQGSNNKTYNSNDAIFEIPQADYHEENNTLTLTISGLDAEDVFYSGANDADNDYDYRIRDIHGSEIAANVATCSKGTAGADGKLTVTVSIINPGTADKFRFRLQRKRNYQGEDKYKDVPDYFDITNIDHFAYDGKEGTVNNNVTFYGRAYDNGTITNKLEGTEEIKVKKLWNNISEDFEDYNYPIADVFLYANIPEKAVAGDYAEDKTQYAKGNAYEANSAAQTEFPNGWGFENGGYTILGGDNNSEEALGELMNILQISYRAGSSNAGDAEEFSFTGKRVIQKDNNGKILYKDNTDYVSFDDNGAYDGTGLSSLPRYDDNGARIDYNVRERAINGYTYRISGDTIINEYNGGDSVQVKVSKTWENMNADMVYPTITFKLYQCYVGKENENDTDNKLLTYRTYTKTFHNTDWEHKDGQGNSLNRIEYIFGGEGSKEKLYRFAPTGEEFFYYLTEELVGAGKPGDNAQTTGDVIFKKTYTVDQNGNINLAGVYTEDKANGNVEINDELTGLGFESNIDESVDLCFPADQRTGVFRVPSVPGDLGDPGDLGKSENYIIQGLPASESHKENNTTVTHNYIYSVVLCDENGNTLTGTQKYSVSLDVLTPTDGKLTVTVTKNENNTDSVYFKLVRRLDGGSEQDKTVTKKSDGSTLWAAKTNEDNTRPLHKVIDITNTYHPDETNYMSKLTIDKAWETFDEKNPLNAEFNHVSNYSFKLKRYAAYIKEQALFKLDTGTTNDGVPVIDITDVYTDNDFQITHPPFTKKADLTVTRTQAAENDITFTLSRTAGSGGASESLPEEYTLKKDKNSLTIKDIDYCKSSEEVYTYTASSTAEGNAQVGTCTLGSPYYGTTITLTRAEYHDSEHYNGKITDPIKVKIRIIDTTDTNNTPSKKVEIEGLSIYAQNGMVYTYVVDEIKMNAYQRKDQNRKEVPVTLTKDGAKVTGGHAEFKLENDLKYFNLNINKVFGTEYKDASNHIKYDTIKPEDYILYFNDEFVKNLQFTLQRKTEDDTTWSDYSILKLDQQKPVRRTSEDYRTQEITVSKGVSTIEKGQFSLHTDSPRKDQYYYTFRYLPIETPEGKKFQYRVIESNANVGDHVSIYYPANNTALPGDGTSAVASDTADLSFKVERSSDNGQTYEPMITGVSASVGGVTFSPQQDGTISIPNNKSVNGEYNISVSGLPLTVTSGNDTIDYTYNLNP